MAPVTRSAAKARVKAKATEKMGTRKSPRARPLPAASMRSNTAIMLVRLPRFSVLGADSLTTSPTNNQVIDIDYEKTCTVGHTGVLLGFSGSCDTWEVVTDKILDRERRGKLQPPSLQNVTDHCVRILNRHMKKMVKDQVSRVKGLLSREELKKKKRKAAYNSSIDLILAQGRSAKFVSLKAKCTKGCHVPTDITHGITYLGSGEEILEPYALGFSTDYCLRQHQESRAAFEERMIDFVAGGIHNCCIGLSSCGGRVAVKTTHTDKHVTHVTFRQLGENYKYCLAPYYRQDEPTLYHHP